MDERKVSGKNKDANNSSENTALQLHGTFPQWKHLFSIYSGDLWNVQFRSARIVKATRACKQTWCVNKPGAKIAGRVIVTLIRMKTYANNRSSEIYQHTIRERNNRKWRELSRAMASPYLGEDNTPHYLCEDNSAMSVRTQLRNILAKTVSQFFLRAHFPTAHTNFTEQKNRV